MRTWIVMLILALCAPVMAQERMKSSEGWHVRYDYLAGPRDSLYHPTAKYLPRGVVLGRDSLSTQKTIDTSRVFIESLDTLKADTCRECPEGYELVHFNDGETCLRQTVTTRQVWTPRGDVTCIEDVPDTVLDVAALRQVIHPTAIDTTWRLIPEGFDKAEWLKLWAIMHPAPVRVNDLVDSLIFWRESLIDSCPNNIQLLYNGATLVDSVSWQEIR